MVADAQPGRGWWGPPATQNPAEQSAAWGAGGAVALLVVPIEKLLRSTPRDLSACGGTRHRMADETETETALLAERESETETATAQRSGARATHRPRSPSAFATRPRAHAPRAARQQPGQPADASGGWVGGRVVGVRGRAADGWIRAGGVGSLAAGAPVFDFELSLWVSRLVCRLPSAVCVRVSLGTVARGTDTLWWWWFSV